MVSGLHTGDAPGLHENSPRAPTGCRSLTLQSEAMHELHDCLTLLAGAGLGRMLDAVQATSCIMSPKGAPEVSHLWWTDSVRNQHGLAAVWLEPQLSIEYDAPDRLRDNTCCKSYRGSRPALCRALPRLRASPFSSGEHRASFCCCQTCFRGTLACCCSELGPAESMEHCAGAPAAPAAS